MPVIYNKKLFEVVTSYKIMCKYLRHQLLRKEPCFFDWLYQGVLLRHSSFFADKHITLRLISYYSSHAMYSHVRFLYWNCSAKIEEHMNDKLSALLKCAGVARRYSEIAAPYCGVIKNETVFAPPDVVTVIGRNVSSSTVSSA